MYQPNPQWPPHHHHMPYYQPYHSPPNGHMNYMPHQPKPKKWGRKQEPSNPAGYQGFGQPQQQSWSPKKPSLMKSAFTGEDGNFDVGRTFQTVDQVVKTVQQVSPIVKQVSPLVKQMSALFIKK